MYKLHHGLLLYATSSEKFMIIKPRDLQVIYSKACWNGLIQVLDNFVFLLAVTILQFINNSIIVKECDDGKHAGFACIYLVFESHIQPFIPEF